MPTLSYENERPNGAADAIALANAPRVHWFCTGSGLIELALTLADAESGSQPGKDASDDIAALRAVPYIAEQLLEVDPETLAAELQGYGAWDADELADHETNLTRLLWIACGDIRDEAATGDV